jgi:16S rRNA (guanine1207-N2)-methyltransferase
MEPLVVPQGQFELARFPVRKNDLLRAWDAADEFLLTHLDEAQVPAAVAEGRESEPSLLILNGGPGALATALAPLHPQVASDSFLDHVATAENLRRNGIATDEVRLLSTLDLTETDPASARLDLVLIKIPKSSALLEDELCRIAPRLHERTVVIAAGMAKHIHTSTLQLFERIIGPTTTSRAVRKARLVFCTPDRSLPAAVSPWPASIDLGGGATAVNHANVFSRDRLDIGTRFFIEQLPRYGGTPDGETHVGEPVSVVDLGCGNGAVGLAMATKNPMAHVTFVDESFMAVASAEATFRANLGTDRDARFVVGDTLFHLASGDPIERGGVDLVLNNPPFHDDHALSDAVAWQMFTESHAALRSGGELWVVGNRHLAYHAKLKRIFGNCDVVAANSKFVVFRAVRS